MNRRGAAVYSPGSAGAGPPPAMLPSRLSHEQRGSAQPKSQATQPIQGSATRHRLRAPLYSWSPATVRGLQPVPETLSPVPEAETEFGLGSVPDPGPREPLPGPGGASLRPWWSCPRPPAQACHGPQAGPAQTSGQAHPRPRTEGGSTPRADQGLHDPGPRAPPLPPSIDGSPAWQELRPDSPRSQGGA